MTGYKFKEDVDLDFRGTGKTYRDSLNEAFIRAGVPRTEFTVTKWGRYANGKSFPVEWRAKNGAEVNIDIGHTKNGPDVPHIGYQTGEKRWRRSHTWAYTGRRCTCK
ncbi:polymorphic toxin type 47 domain-containing protein [Aeribacillus pallidus]|nr:polymorphic toxin type 47 domain-containing protein [Aeribacillus pallidus]